MIKKKTKNLNHQQKPSIHYMKDIKILQKKMKIENKNKIDTVKPLNCKRKPQILIAAMNP